MNKEQQELLDEVYRKYADSHWTPPSNPKGKLLSDQLFSLVPMEHSKESFINKCKTDSEFSERWGLKIEERELCKLERINVAIEKKLTHKTAHLTKDFDYQKWCDEQNIPTKLITITYNDTKLESYE
jgi:hypothetical protein